MGTITKYASVLEAFHDGRFRTNDWSNLENGVGNTNVATSSRYSENFVPMQLYAHDFGINLPNQYTIKSIKFEVKLRGNVKDTRVPTGYFDLLSIGEHTLTDYGDSVYSAQPNVNISDSYNIITYEMGKDDAEKFKATKRKIQDNRFGIILLFDKSKFTGAVSVEWIRATVSFDEPQYITEIRGHTTPNDWEAKYLYKYRVGDFFSVLFYVHNPISFQSDPKTVHLEIPVGLRIDSYEESTGASFDPNTRDLTLDWSGIGSPFVKIYFRATTIGLKELSIVGDSSVGSTTQYLYITEGVINEQDDERVIISPTDVRKCDYCDFNIGIRAYSRDNVATYDYRFHGLDPTDTNIDTFVSFELDKSRTSPEVSVIGYTTSSVSFNVPESKEVDIYFKVKFLSDFQGEDIFKLIPDDTGYVYEYEYESLEPFRYVADVRYDNSKDIVFTNCRMVSVVDTGVYIYPMSVSEYDNPLLMDKSSLRLSKYEDLDYIGCVPLEQTHYSPKSTYKDTLLNTTYKNKRYMGKKGVIDETITLNVRLHPYQVTTIQGLIDMDKPVPLNTNHRSFEGDSLNHRGWVELYGITSKKTNPHWYDCDLSVKYITHNLNTRFNINKGSKVSDYFLPELMEDVCYYGGDLTENFNIETDGGYNYSKDVEDYHMRNMLALPNGKKFTITSTSDLAFKSQVNLNWYSTRNVENQDNNVSRIVRLIDSETNNTVLEYEWYDIDWSRTYEYTSKVICRVLHKGAFKTLLNRNLVLNTDAEYDPVQLGDVDVYGSELIFKLVGDKLSIQDCGASGKELYIEDIDLQNGEYYIEVEFSNNNIDFYTPDVVNWIDIAVKKLSITTSYDSYYNHIVISPFPIPAKTVVFTRESEEGSIFYLYDDYNNDETNEFTYLVNPYFQYHCGVDLQTRDGISIFNLDNNYQVFYITNGLVKVGINRYNGKMTLAKYDKYSKTYIITNHLQFTKYEDININSFSDDKIEVQISDTILTMWRGHPYVLFQHPTEDILLTEKFTKIYADGVGNKTSDIPINWTLVDYTNLLPECVASNRKIKADCFSLTEEDVEDPSQNLSIQVIENGGMASPSFIVADCPYPWQGMKFIIDGKTYDGIEPESEDVLSFTHKIYHQFESEGTHTVKAVYWNNNDYYFSPTIDVNIVDNAYRITQLFPEKMYYMEHDFTCKLTLAKVPVAGEVVTFYVNGLSYPKTTDSNGIARLNNRLPAVDTPYHVTMTHSEGGNVVARADTECLITKGYVNIDLFSSDYVRDHSKPKRTVTRGGYVVAKLTNNLDPSDDDIEPDEQYIKNKQIVMSVNGRDYLRTTDNNGEATLNINLPQGSYDIKVTFAGDHQYMGSIKNFEIGVKD